ncbi:MAG: glycosyltransferase family 9 protein [Bryobacteraceae bacterium]
MRRLLIRPGAIGDCIVSFPALEFLKTQYTELWLPTPVVPLIQFADRVCSISSTGLDYFGIEGLSVPARLIDTLSSFDEVVSWYGAKRPEFRSALSRVCKRCTFFEALPTDVRHEHATDFYARQVGAPLGLKPRIRTAQLERRESVVIHPFSGGVRKNWPLSCFEALSCNISDKAEWLAGPEEKLGQAYRFDNLPDLANWIRAARLYVGNDSGITHLAAATGVKTLALFGPTDPVVWAPRGESVMVLRHEPISELPVTRVLENVNRLLGLP